MFRRSITRMALAAVMGLGLAFPATSQAQDWKAQIKEFRIGLLGGENTADKLKDTTASRSCCKQSSACR